MLWVTRLKFVHKHLVPACVFAVWRWADVCSSADAVVHASPVHVVSARLSHLRRDRPLHEKTGCAGGTKTNKWQITDQSKGLFPLWMTVCLSSGCFVAVVCSWISWSSTPPWRRGSWSTSTLSSSREWDSTVTTPSSLYPTIPKPSQTKQLL